MSYDLTEFFAVPSTELGTEPPWRELRWVTKDGQVIPVKEMATSHIQNCHRLMQDGMVRNVGEAARLVSFGHGEKNPIIDSATARVLREASQLSAWVCIFQMELDYRKKHDILLV